MLKITSKSSGYFDLCYSTFGCCLKILVKVIIVDSHIFCYFCNCVILLWDLRNGIKLQSLEYAQGWLSSHNNQIRMDIFYFIFALNCG